MIRYLCLLLTMSSWVWGETVDREVRILVFRGDVLLSRGEEAPRQVKVNDLVVENDVIETGRRGRVQLGFSDGTVLSIGKNTTLELSEYALNREQKSAALVITVPEGFFRIMGGAIAQLSPENFKAKTPTATIGIRGSMFEALVASTQTKTRFLGGRGVYVQNYEGLTDLDEVGDSSVSGTYHAPSKPLKLQVGPGEEQWVNHPLLTGTLQVSSLSGNIVDLVDPESTTSGRGSLAVDEIYSTSVVNVGSGVEGTVETVNNVALVEIGSAVGISDNNTLFSTEIGGLEVAVNPLNDDVAGTMELNSNSNLGSDFITANEMAITGNEQQTITTIEGIDGGTQTLQVTAGTFSGSGNLGAANTNVTPPEYVSWGPWQLTLLEDLRGESVERVIANGLWVRGQVTEAATVDRLVNDTRGLIGSYNGAAMMWVNNSEFFTGTSNLFVNFSNGSVNGNLNFGQQPTVFLNNGVISGNGFSGNISIDGEFLNNAGYQGQFYGPGAESVGGTFQGQGSNSYHGAFGGNGVINTGQTEIVTGQ